jgi:hypothetical protein
MKPCYDEIPEEPPTTLETVLFLLDHIIRPVLMPYQTKKPKTEGWPQNVITREAAPALCNGSRMNVGAILGVDGLADGDMDCSEAVLAASVLMPPTGFIFGRPSRPRSHFFYRLTPAIPSLKFSDPLLLKEKKKDEATIAELRCLKKDGTVGFQTVTPWSTHPSGEPIRFEEGGDKDPASLDADVLVRAVSRVAAAALLARYFPPEKGGRNEAFMAIAGILARAECTIEDAINFNFAIYAVLWPGTADLSACASEVRPTFTKYAGGKDTIGATRLKKLIDERVVLTALEWLNIAPNDPRPKASADTPPTKPRAAHPATVDISRFEPSLELLNSLMIWQGRIDFMAVKRKGPMLIATTTDNIEIVWPSTAELNVFTKSQAVIADATNILIPTPPQGEIRKQWEEAASLLLKLAAKDDIRLEPALKEEIRDLLRLVWRAADQPTAKGSDEFIDFVRAAQRTRRNPKWGGEDSTARMPPSTAKALTVAIPPCVFIAEEAVWVHVPSLRLWASIPAITNTLPTLTNVRNGLLLLGFVYCENLSRGFEGDSETACLWRGPLEVLEG